MQQHRVNEKHRWMNGQKQISEDSKELGSSKDSQGTIKFQKSEIHQCSLRASNEKSIVEEEEKDDSNLMQNGGKREGLNEHSDDTSSSYEETDIQFNDFDEMPMSSRQILEQDLKKIHNH